jgi:hypothetical protein
MLLCAIYNYVEDLLADEILRNPDLKEVHLTKNPDADCLIPLAPSHP